MTSAAYALASLAADPKEPARLRRTFDPRNLNRIARHPDVFPWLGAAVPADQFDLSAIVCHPANVALESELGGYVLENHGQGQYEAHTLFLPEGRRAAYELAVAGFRYLFTATDCERIVTNVPAGNLSAAAHAKRCGFEEVFSRPAAWNGPNGPEDVSYQELTIERWMTRDSVLAGKGVWFHDELERAKIAAESAREIHEDDEVHDRAAGAAVLMFQAGNAAKAVGFYNRWAALAGYAPISLVTLTPLVVDVVDAVIEVTTDGLEVLLCR